MKNYGKKQTTKSSIQFAVALAPLLVLPAGFVQAQSTCGATGNPLTGNCTSSGNSYSTGIALGGTTTPVATSAELNIGAGVIVTTTSPAGRRGITIVSNGAATISALSGVTVNTTATGANAIGIFTRTLAANGDSSINVVNGAVTTNGTNANGVWADATGGANASVTFSGSVMANGATSVGIEASAIGAGSAMVVASGTITTTGTGPSHALEALASGSGAATLTFNGGMVQTSGNGASGLLSRSGTGSATLGVAPGTTVTTGGSNALAIFAISDGGAATVDATNVTVTTNGSGSMAINAQSAGSGNASLTASGTIQTLGANGISHGVQANATGSGNASLVFESGSVTTTSGASFGLISRAVSGTATLETRQGVAVTTNGVGSWGLFAFSQNNDATLDAPDITVTTNANGGIGLEAQASGAGNATAIVSGNVTTNGLGASGSVQHGIVASTDNIGNAALIYSNGTVATMGTDSVGLVARSGSGNVSVNASADTHILTQGNNSYGIFAVTQTMGSTAPTGASIDIISNGDITTRGVTANGILARSHLDAPISVTANNGISTYGAGATAILATSEGGALLATPQNTAGGNITIISSAPIMTFGASAGGILARTLNNAAASGVAGGMVEIRSSADVTLDGGGSNAIGLYAASRASSPTLSGGAASVIASGNITTSNGVANHGIEAEAQGTGGSASVTYTTGTITVSGISDGIRVTDRNGGIAGTGSINLSDGATINASSGRFGLFGGEAGSNSISIAAGSSVLGGWNTSINAAGVAFITLGRSPNDTLINSGAIGAMNDAAVRGDGGAGSALSMTNNASGVITGTMTLGGGTNSLNNAGTWSIRNFSDSDGDQVRDRLAVAISDFGASGNNTIVNSGTINVLGRDAATAQTLDTTGIYLPLGLSFNSMSLNSPVQGQILGVQTFSNSGVIDLTANLENGNPNSPVAGDVLVISGGHTVGADGGGVFVANGGTLRLNTVLNEGGANSQSDILVVDSTRLGAGATSIIITPVGGNGALTVGNGIVLVEVLNKSASADGVFTLSGRLAAGAYEYLLFHNGIGADATDGNWYLRNIVDTPDGPVPNVRPEVPIDMVIPPLALEYGYAMLDTLHERVGETWVRPMAPVVEERTVWCKDPARNFRCTVRVPVAAANGADKTRWASSGWARLIGERGFRDNDNFFRRGADYNYTFSGIQAGLDIFGREKADGTIDKSGIYVGYGQISSNVKDAFGGKAGSVDMDATTIGGYWTHFSPNGWYSDAVVQGTFYSADGRSIYGQQIKPDGFGVIASLETGYAFKLGNDWTLEPQAQLAYQHVSFDSSRDQFGFVSFADGESLRGRLGLRLAKTWNMADELKPRLISAWLRANVWHEFLGNTRTSFGSIDGQSMVPFKSDLDGTWTEIGVGVSGQVAESVSLFGTAAYNRSLDNKGREAWDGRLGVTVKW